MNRSNKKKSLTPTLGGTPTKPKAKFGGRGNRGNFRIQASVPTSLINTGTGQGVSAFYMNPGFFVTYIRNIAESYQLFRVIKFTMEYVPIVGATTAGAVRLAYFDNPETIYKTDAGVYSTADLQNLVFSSTTSPATSSWNSRNFPCPTNRLVRRKWYSIDSTAMANAEVADRVMPALAITTYEGPATTNLGYFMIHFIFELKDLAAATTTPLLLLKTPDGYFQGPDGQWWKRVTGGVTTTDPPTKTDTLSDE